MRGSAGPPVGQEQTVRALAAAMLRGILVVGGALTVAVTVGGGVVTGPAGALSALLGGLVGVGSSLLTPWLMRRTAHREPRAVMAASLGGFLQKMILLLVGLFVAGSIPGVQRTVLAVGLLVVLVGVTAAQGWAGYRLPTAVVDLPGAAAAPATSASATGSPASATAGSRPDVPPNTPAADRDDHQR